MKKTDEDIMMDYLGGNDEGVGVIFQRYKSRILNFCYRILGNRADAEEIVGDVFVAVFSKKYTYQTQAKFSTWLYTVARNACLNRLRTKKRLVGMWFRGKNGAEDEQWDIPDTSEYSDDDLDKKEIKNVVKQAVHVLPRDQKEALILREYHRLSYQEISEILGCSLSNVKILIFRAREQLKQRLSSLIKEDLS